MNANNATNPFISHRRVNNLQMRKYVPGESLENINVPEGTTPAEGGFICRDNEDSEELRYLTAEQAAEWEAIPAEELV